MILRHPFCFFKNYKYKLILFFAIFNTTNVFPINKSFIKNTDHVFYALSESKNLPSEEIKKIFKDKQGFMWFATPDGLFKYDGHDLKVYSTTNFISKGLITNNIVDIVQDNNGYLWLASDHGIGKFDLQNETFNFYNPVTQSWDNNEYNLINSLAIDNDNNLWIGTAGNGVFKFNINTGKTTMYNNKNRKIRMESQWITKVYCDSFNNIWICSWEGNLLMINENKQIYLSCNKLSESIDFKKNSPYCFKEDDNHKYWIGLWGKGIAQIKLENNKTIKVTNTINLNQKNSIIYDIDIDKNKNLWLGTPNGVTKVSNPQLKDNTIEQYSSTEKNTEQYEVFSVYCDNANLIWAGTITGINLLDPYSNIFTPYKIKTNNIAQYSQATTAFTTDSNGKLLISVRGLGFGTYDIKTKEFNAFKNIAKYKKINPELNAINCFFWDSNGNLWLGTRYLGLIKFDPKTGNCIEINKSNPKYKFTAETVQSIIEDHIGNLWVGTEKGIYKILPFTPVNFSNFSIIHYQHNKNDLYSLSSDKISNIIENSDKQIWITTYDKGVNLLTSDIETHLAVKFSHFNKNQKGRLNLPSDQIISILEDKNSTLWIGTGGGELLKKEQDKEGFQAVENIKNIFGSSLSNSIVGLLEDNQGNLWISSANGLLKFNLNDKHPSYIYFSQSQGLQSNYFNKNAVYKDANGKLFFGGNKGFNCFIPEKIRSNAFIPPVAISTLTIGNKYVPYTQKEDTLNLKYDNNSLSITLSALSYSSPEDNNFATKLEGIDDNWHYTKGSYKTVTYGNLKPGSYNFLYTASNNNGLWHRPYKQLKIIVHPAIYATRWAVSIYIIIILSTLFYIIYKQKETARIMNALEIEHFKHKKSVDLLQFKKQFFANISNEFISPLNILYVFIENWRNKKTTPSDQDLTVVQRNINRLIRYNKQFLYYSTAETNKISLNIQSKDLSLFIEEIFANFSFAIQKKEIQFHKNLQINSNNLFFDTEKLDIILHNLLTNAINNSTYKAIITFSILTTYKNSINFADFSITYKSSDSIGNQNEEQEENIIENFGIGMALTKQLIELHKGTLNIKENSIHEKTVSFAIPVSDNIYENIDYSEKQHKKSTKIDFLKNPIQIEENILTNLRNISQTRPDSTTILIIESDSDLRKVIKSQLVPFFNVKEATNTQSGLNYIMRHNTDIVVTDMMSSHFSAINLCSKVKQDHEKQNIPFIILSGHPSDAERARCYKAGADSYFPKPFDFNTLLIRIQNLLELKNKLSASANISNHFISKFTPNTSKDDKFLNEVKKIVEQNLQDSNFNVKTLVGIMNISNSMLYRKLTELIQLNPNNFIKKMRLIKATELLESTDLNISEIAFNCGFNDISYFGYSFKKEYGISPTEYRRDLTKQKC